MAVYIGVEGCNNRLNNGKKFGYQAIGAKRPLKGEEGMRRSGGR
jgi:hypothetical protein